MYKKLVLVEFLYKLLVIYQNIPIKLLVFTESPFSIYKSANLSKTKDMSLILYFFTILCVLKIFLS